MKHPPTKPALLVLKAIFAAAVLIGLVSCGGGGSTPLTVTVTGF